MANKSRTVMRKVRHVRIRKNLMGTPERPRMSVYRSNKHLVVQVVDDVNGVTLAAASTHEKALSAGGNVEGAKKVGEAVAKRAKDKGIKQVVFDRGGFRYMGSVKELAEGARSAGLEF